MIKSITSGFILFALVQAPAIADTEQTDMGQVSAETEANTDQALVDGDAEPLIAEQETEQGIFRPEKISFGLSLGVLNGKAKERVYLPEEGGRKVSQLDWKYNNAPIVKLVMDWDVLRRVSLGASAWTTFARSNGSMDDYDWFLASQNHWTDHSHHPDTDLRHANEYDVNIKGWLFLRPTWRLGVMAGYQENHFSFESHGGSYNYSNGQEVGVLPSGLKVTEYDISTKLPYIGLVGKYRQNKLEFGGTLKYSGWARSSDVDEHLLRQITFKDKVAQQSFYALSGNLAYYYTDHIKFYLDAAWSLLENKKGSVSVDSHNGNPAEIYTHTSGIQNHFSTVTLGVKYAF